MAETSSRRDHEEHQYLSCMIYSLGSKAKRLRRPLSLSGVASRKARTSTVLGSLGRIGRVHGDDSRKLKRERSMHSTKVSTIPTETMRGGQKEGGQGEGRAFWVREAALAEKIDWIRLAHAHDLTFKSRATSLLPSLSPYLESHRLSWTPKLIH